VLTTTKSIKNNASICVQHLDGESVDELLKSK